MAGWCWPAARPESGRAVSCSNVRRDLLAGLDRHRQPVLRRRQRAGRQVGVGAGEVGRAVEVDQHRAVGVRCRDRDRTVGRIGGHARGGVGEQDVEAAGLPSVERGQPVRRPVELELDLPRGVVHMLEALDRCAHGHRARLLEGQVAAGQYPARVRFVCGSAGEGDPERVVGVTRAQDVVPAALGDLDHRVAGRDVEARPLGDHPEAVPPADPNPVDGELLALGQVHDHPVGGTRPCARRVLEPAGLLVQPVQTGDGQEPVRVGQHPLMRLVPLLPLLDEAVPVDLLNRHTSILRAVCERRAASVCRGRPTSACAQVRTWSRRQRPPSPSAATSIQPTHAGWTLVSPPAKDRSRLAR